MYALTGVGTYWCRHLLVCTLTGVYTYWCRHLLV